MRRWHHSIIGPLLVMMLLLTGMTRAGGGVLDLAHSHGTVSCDPTDEHLHHHRSSIAPLDQHPPSEHAPHSPPHVHLPDIDVPGPRTDRPTTPAAELDAAGSAAIEQTLPFAPQYTLLRRVTPASPSRVQTLTDRLRTTRILV